MREVFVNEGSIESVTIVRVYKNPKLVFRKIFSKCNEQFCAVFYVLSVVEVLNWQKVR